MLGALLLTTTAGAASAAPRALTLNEAVQLALRSDPSLAQASVQRERAHYQALRAQLDRVSLKLDGSIQTLFNKSNIGGPELYNCDIGGTSFSSSAAQCSLFGGVAAKARVQSPERKLGALNLQAALNVPIFSGFRVQSNVQRTEKLEDVSVAAVRQARKDVALSVARVYWQLRRFALMHEVQEQSLARLREAEGVIASRVQAGLAPPIDKNRAVLRRLQAEAALSELAGQEREAAAQLGVALNLQGELVLVDAPHVPEEPPAPAETLVARARGERPELRIARLSLEAQGQALRMAQSAYYPQLSGFGLFQFTNTPLNYLTGTRGSSDGINPFRGLAGNFTVGLQLSMNFFDTLNTWTQVQDAKLEQSRLTEDLRQKTRIVEADVRTAHARVARLYERRMPLVAALDVARDNEKILQARYLNGDALVIEYLEGQNDLINAEQQVVDVTTQLQEAWYELDASLGRVVGLEDT